MFSDDIVIFIILYRNVQLKIYNNVNIYIEAKNHQIFYKNVSYIDYYVYVVNNDLFFLNKCVWFNYVLKTIEMLYYGQYLYVI